MEEQYEKIEAYLDKQLSAAETQSFEKAMEEDQALAREVELHRRMESVLGDEKEWRFRQNLEALRNSVPDGELEGPQQGKTGRAGKFLLGVLILIVLASLAYWYTVPAPSPEGEAPRPEVTTPVEPQPEEITPEDPPPVAEEEETPPAEPERLDPYAASPELEGLARSSPLSNIYEFDLRSIVEGNAPKQLRLDGEMLSAQWEGNTPFVVEVFSNDPAQYPGNPVMEGELLLQLIEEDTPIAFAAKQAYIANYEAPLDLDPGVYYYQVRLQGEEEALWVGRFKL